MIKTNNERARDAWNTNASFWDRRMGDGNDFFEQLVWPSVARLFCPREGEQILDVACGNGVTCRRLARAGAKVLGVDFSEEMIRHAKERHGDGDVDYRVVDATNPEALRVLGSGSFDGALCNMALMDVADSRALMAGVRSLLKPNGRFVFSVLHPCFNNPATVQVGELEDRQGAIVTTYSVKVSRYLTPYTQVGMAMHDQPVPHPYFHRPLEVLLGEAFDAGFVLDGLEERSFPGDNTAGTAPLSWNGRFSEIPPVLIGRLRPNGGIEPVGTSGEPRVDPYR
jgi:2-polyprenyl-3-methyl-5-hydroxy-6-metoxy-1,4-benzoquinol methylase